MAKRQTYTRSPDWISRTILDGNYSILLPLINKKADLDQFYRMNETAAFLWNNLKKPSNPPELLKKLKRGFHITNDISQGVEQEIKSLLDDWVKIGAVSLK